MARRCLSADEAWAGIDAVNGDDTNAPGNETSVPFQTPEALIDHLYRDIDLCGYAVTVYPCAGTFTGLWNFDGPIPGGRGPESLQFIGSPSDQFFIDNQSNGTACISVANGARVSFKSLRMRSNASVYSVGALARDGATIRLEDWWWSGGYLGGSDSRESSMVAANDGAKFEIIGGGLVDGSSDTLFAASHGGKGRLQAGTGNPVVTFSGTIGINALHYARDLSGIRYVATGSHPWSYDETGVTWTRDMRPMHLQELSTLSYSAGDFSTFPGSGEALIESGSCYFHGQSDHRNKIGSLTTDNATAETVHVDLGFTPSAILFKASAGYQWMFDGWLGSADAWAARFYDNSPAYAGQDFYAATGNGYVGTIVKSASDYTRYKAVLTATGFDLVKTTVGGPDSFSVKLVYLALA